MTSKFASMSFVAVLFGLIAFAAKGSEPVPYIAMPIDKGLPNALCARDVISARVPRYPLTALSSDPATWSRELRGNGLYRLDINLKTGRVNRVTIVKSAGSKYLDSASTWAFNRWVLTPGKWSAVIIPTTVRVTWVPVLIQEREL